MHTGAEPRRSLGLATSTSMVIGNMVGSGVFLLPASLAVYGMYSLWGWLVSAGGAMALAWVFSSLSRRTPLAGGKIVNMSKEIGPQGQIATPIQAAVRRLGRSCIPRPEAA